MLFTVWRYCHVTGRSVASRVPRLLGYHVDWRCVDYCTRRLSSSSPNPSSSSSSAADTEGWRPARSFDGPSLRDFIAKTDAAAPSGDSTVNDAPPYVNDADYHGNNRRGESATRNCLLSTIHSSGSLSITQLNWRLPM